MNLLFDAIGTRWEIETREPLPAEVRDAVLERARRFDATYSRFRPDSLVTRVAAAPEGDRFEFPDDSIGLFDLYDRLVAATDGGIDPLVGRDLELLGYDATYSLKPAGEASAGERVRTRSRWVADVIRDGTTLVTRNPVVIDVGAVGKGHLVDLIAAILRDAGVGWFVVDGSGDLRQVNEAGIRVGLEHPFDPRRVVGVVPLTNTALCASAPNRRAWGAGSHHLLDARTGTPVRDVVATFVIADDAAVADGLATALFVTEAARLTETFTFTYVRILADGRVKSSPDFAGELFT